MDQDEERWGSGPGLVVSLWRYRWVIAAITLLFGGVAYVLSTRQPPMYTATAQVLFKDPRDPGLLGSAQNSRFIEPESYLAQQAQKMKSPAVLEAAATSLAGNVTAEAVGEAVSTSSDVELNMVSVTAERRQPSEASAFANAVAGAYEAVAAEETQADAERAVAAIEAQLDDLRARAEEAEAAVAADPEDTVVAGRARILTERIIAMEATASNIAAQAAVEGSGVEAIRQAQVPERPSSPDPARDAVMAAALAFILASVGAYWLAGRDNSIRSAAEAAEVLGAPLLGEVPKYRVTDGGTVAGRLSVPPAAAEAFQFVLSSIEYALSDVASAAVLVTSASAGDGKTVSALQLALAARRDGRDVTLVDSDLRAQGLTTLLGANESPGLADLVRGQASAGVATKRYRIDDDVILPVVTAGERAHHAAGLLRSGGLDRALRALREGARLLVLDSPPLLAVVDASVAASHVDGVVLVVSPDTSVQQLQRVKERLAFVDTPVLGYVYNRAESDVAPYDYTYGASKDGGWRGRLRRKAGSAQSVTGPVAGGRTDRPRARVSPFNGRKLPAGSN